MKVRLSSRALREFSAAVEFYLEDGPAAARSFGDELEAAFRHLGRYPNLAAPTAAAGVRAKTLRRFPYRVFYEIGPHEIRVLSIFHTSRKPDDLS